MSSQKHEPYLTRTCFSKAKDSQKHESIQLTKLKQEFNINL